VNAEYFTSATLAKAAGVCMRVFQRHLQLNVGQVQAARETIPGLGVVYEARKCRKYLALCLADPRRKAKAQRQEAAV